MSVTELHHPPVSVADRLHTAARFIEVLGDPGTTVLSTTVFSDGGLNVQVVMDSGPTADRRGWLAAAAGVLTDSVHTEPTVYGTRDGSWGSFRVRGTYEGVAVEVWTALSWAEARDLGLAICAACEHTDHDGEECLVAGFDNEGDERACECGRPDAETILLEGGAITSFDVAAAQALAIVSERRHEERCEQSDDDLRDAAAERDAR